jgi:hypothetical protein
MKKLLHGLVALPLLAASAFAQPMQLTDKQMDKVSAGFFFLEVHNTGGAAFSLFFRPYLTDETPNYIKCDSCYLVISTPTFSLASFIGRPVTLPTGPPE